MKKVLEIISNVLRVCKKEVRTLTIGCILEEKVVVLPQQIQFIYYSFIKISKDKGKV